ncbi:MAG: GNAT family N-acetyltransferase [Chloroflexota bacterium]
MGIEIREAREEDFEAIAGFDLTYPTDRFLRIERSGTPPEQTVSFKWQDRPESRDAVYNAYPVERLMHAKSMLDAFFVAESAGVPVGLLMVIVPGWANSAEITDFAVDRGARRQGAGRALLEAAMAWARQRGHVALWVEPRADNAPAIDFYMRTGFRLSGYNDHLYSNADDEPGQQTLYLHLEL